MPAPLLQVENLCVSYGPIQAVRGVSFEVGPAEIVTLIGANGAGKTTILRAISGVVKSAGRMEFEGRDLRRLRPDQVVAGGIVHVPEGRGLFGNLTVRENLMLAAWHRKPAAMRAELDRVLGLFPRLGERRSQSAGTLSGGEQQMLALGRALMAQARLILLDEPSMGLAPVLVQEMFGLLADLRQSGTGILLVEQNASLALRLARRAYVLETGCIVMAGPAEELRRDERIRQAYLGGPRTGARARPPPERIRGAGGARARREL